MNTIFHTIRIHPKKVVTVDLTSPQTSGMGEILHEMYYNTSIIDSLGDLVSGYSHKGDTHSLCFKGPYEDVIAGIELIRDQTPVRFHPMIVEAKMNLTMICNQIRMMVESKK